MISRDRVGAPGWRGFPVPGNLTLNLMRQKYDSGTLRGKRVYTKQHSHGGRSSVRIKCISGKSACNKPITVSVLAPSPALLQAVSPPPASALLQGLLLSFLGFPAALHSCFPFSTRQSFSYSNTGNNGLSPIGI